MTDARERRPVHDLIEGRRSEAAIRHLLAGCAACSEELDRALGRHRAPPSAGGPVEDGHLEVVVRRVAERVGAARDRAQVEEQAAPALLGRLLPHPRGRRLTVVRSSWQYHLPQVVELLCERSRQALGVDPAEAVALAELAVEAADRLPAGEYGEALCCDLRGRSRVFRALACRKGSEFASAEKDLAAAEAWLRRGSRDLGEMAWMLEVRGSLRTRQRRFDEAHRDFRLALRCHRRAGNRHLLGRVYSRIARAWSEASEPERDARVLALALDSVDVTDHRRLAMTIAHNLVEAFVSLGERERALRVIEVALPAYQAFATPIDRLALRWTEARIHAHLGDLERAAEGFRAAREGFLQHGLVVEAALSSLDWALVEARRGRPDRVAQIAAEMAPIFDSRQLTRETLAALSLFRQAARERGATAGMIRAVARVVRSRRGGAAP